MARTLVAASSEKITLGLGNLGFVFGPGTIAAIIRPTVVNAVQFVFCAGVATPADYGLRITALGVLELDVGGANPTGVTALTAGKWYLVAGSKAAGTVTSRYHIYDYAADGWVHENSALTAADATAPITEAKIGVNPAGTLRFFDGDIAIAAVWDVVLTDSQAEALADAGLASWYAPANPRALWVLDQASTAQKILDTTGGHADETALTGTAVSVNSVPLWTPDAASGVIRKTGNPGRSLIVGIASEVDSALAISPAFSVVRLRTPRVVALARYRAEVAWEQSPGGLFVLGSSLLGGPDPLAASSWSETFSGLHDDISADLHDDGIETIRGRTDDLAMMAAGAATLHLRDPEGKYNRENPASVLVGLLNPLRPLRISAALDLRSCVLSDRPAAYWRLGEAAGSTVAADAVGAFPADHGAGVTAGSAGLLEEDPDRAASYSAAATSLTSPAAATSLARAFSGTTAWGIEARVSALTVDANSRVVFSARKAGSTARVEITVTNAHIRVTRHDGSAGDDLDYAIALTAAARQIVATYDGATLRLYLDGALVASAVSTRALPILTAVAIGNDATSPDPLTAFVGRLDEVAVFQYQLAADSILAHYDAAVATRFPIFYGFTRRIEQGAAGRGGTATITAVDLFQRLRRAKPTIASTGPTTVGAAWGLLLNWIEWTDPLLRSLATGDALSDFSADGTINILQIGSNLLDIDRGAFFIGASGSAKYVDRNARALASVQSTIANVMRAVASGADLDQIVNEQTVTKTGSLPQIASDPTSINRYGESADAEIESPWLADDPKALGLAQYIVTLRKDPGSDLWTLELKNRDSATLRAMLARDLTDRVVVSEAQTGFSGDYHVEQVAHRISRGGRYHATNWRMSEHRETPFTLGVSLLGGTDPLGF